MSTVDAAASAVTAPNAAATVAAAGDADNTLSDYDDFLTLLTAQLRNQDPLDPEDSTEFVAQIATFTQVEQQINTNDKLDALIAAQTGSAVEQLGRFVGNDIVADGLNIAYDGGQIELTTPQVSGASKVEVVITNQNGQPVARIPAETRGGSVTWDGSLLGNANAAPGVYGVEYEITRTTSAGDEVETQTPQSQGRVIEARFDADGEVELLLEGGVIVVSPAAVQAVYEAPVAASATQTTTQDLADAAGAVSSAAEAVVQAAGS
ncbi:MAG: flagellar hook capping FlgD N-terminal domain-containing protein [Pseudomonadota bacterium]